MKIFKHQNITPRSGYYYIDPDTGFRVEEGLLSSLIQSATRHREINNLHIPADFAEIVQDWLCSKNPDSFWMEKPVPNPVIPTSTTGSGIIGTTNETISLLKVLGGGTLKLVSREEAIRRADICLACGNNVADKACYSCTVEGAIKALLKVPPVPRGFFLSTCKVCNCFNKAQIHCEATVLASKVSETLVDSYPVSCWKHKILKEYYNDKAKSQKPASPIKPRTSKPKTKTTRKPKTKSIRGSI